MRVEGHEIHHLRELFGLPDGRLDDEVWISRLDAQGDWSFITQDKRIGVSGLAREALMRSRLVAFFLAPAWLKLSPFERLGRLALWMPRIIQAAETIERESFDVPVRFAPTARLRGRRRA